MYPVPILILDGGLGTTIKDQYHAEVDGETRPLWSSHLLISEPTKLLDVQTAFADAGADIILTATYQASVEGFANTVNPQDGRLGISRAEAEGYMRSAVGISRASFRNIQATRGGGSVALSLGAYGAVMVPSQEYTGKYDEEHRSVEQLRDWHKTRLDIFTEMEDVFHAVDMIAFETVPLLAEIEAVRQTISMVQRNSADCKKEKPFWISCVFPGKELHLADGSTVDDVVRAMLSNREDAAMPFAVGINCTKIGKLAELLREFEAAVKRMIEARELDHSPALVLYPDGTKGEVYNTTTHEWEMPEQSHDLVGISILRLRTLHEVIFPL